MIDFKCEKQSPNYFERLKLTIVEYEDYQNGGLKYDNFRMSSRNAKAYRTC